MSIRQKTAIITAVLITAAAITSCKKSEKGKILEEQARLAGKAKINVQISDLDKRIKASRKESEKSRLYNEKAMKEAEKGDINSSIASSKESIKINPRQAGAHFVLGRAYLRDGNYMEAKKEFRTALEYNKKHGPSHFELGNLYYKQLKYTAAVKEYKLAVKYDKRHYMAYNNLGVVYYLKGKGKKALKALKKARKLKPEYPGVYKNLGIVYELNFKKKKTALAFYRKYLKMCPNTPERKAVKLWISAIGG